MNQEFFLNFLYYSFHLDDCEKPIDENNEYLQGASVITSFQWTPFMIDGYLR